MKLRIIIALLITLILLSIARHISQRKPELKVVESEGIKIEHTTVVEKIGEGDVDIFAKISTPEPIEKYQVTLAYKIDQGDFLSVAMLPKDENSKSFFTTIPSQSKGKRAYYYLAVTDKQGQEVSFPDRVKLLNPPFMIKFKGKVSPFVLIAHIIAMFGGVFFVFLVLFSTVDLLRGKDVLKSVNNFSLLTTLFIFLGGFPLGFLVAHQTFGVAWSGIPFGWDITDNKTVILLVYWLILLYLMKGTVFKKRAELNLTGHKSISILTILGVILTLLIYLIPHSI